VSISYLPLTQSSQIFAAENRRQDSGRAQYGNRGLM